MPVTPQQKLEILQKHGIDPAKYWIDNKGNVVVAPDRGPIVAGLASTLYNAPSTIGSLTGAGVGTAAGGALGGPVGGFAGGAAGAMGGGALGRTLQNNLYSDSLQEDEARRQMLHPDATKIAAIATSLATVRPSLSVAKQLASIPRSLQTGARINAAQMGAIGQVGSGVGLGVGSNLAEQALSDQPFSKKSLAEAALLSLLQQKATKLGRAASLGTLPPHVETADPRVLADGMRKAYTEQQDKFLSNGGMDVEGALTKAAEERAILESVVGKANEQRLAEEAAMKSFDTASAIDPSLFAYDGPGAPATSRIVPEIGLPKKPVVGQRVGGSPVVPEGTELVTQPTARDIPSVLDGPTDIQGDLPQNLVAAKPGFDQLNKIASTPEMLAWWAKHLKETGDIDVDVQDLEARKLAGIYNPRETAADPAKVTIGQRHFTHTAPHEGMHGMINDTLRFGSAGERAFLNKALDKLGIPLDEHGFIDPAIEEPLVQQIGEDVVGRIVNPEVADRYTDDRGAWKRFKAGEHTKDDAMRLLSNRYLRDRGLAGSVRTAAKALGKVKPVVGGAIPVDNEPVAEAAPVVENKSVVEDIPDVAEPEKLDLEGLAIGNNVGRAVNTTYEGQSIPANARIGKANKAAALESPADLEARRVEDKLSGRDRSRYQGLDVDQENSSNQSDLTDEYDKAVAAAHKAGYSVGQQLVGGAFIKHSLLDAAGNSIGKYDDLSLANKILISNLDAKQHQLQNSKLIAKYESELSNSEALPESANMPRPPAAQVHTPAFLNWFGDWKRAKEITNDRMEGKPVSNEENAQVRKGLSKVVDSMGAPLVVYHGTKRGVGADGSVFNVLSTEHTVEMGQHFGTADQARDFTRVSPSDKNEAGQYAPSSFFAKRGVPTEAPRTYPVYLDIKNPFHSPDLFGTSPAPFIRWANSNKVFDNSIIENANAAVNAKNYREGWQILKRALQAKGFDGVTYVNEGEGAVGGEDNVAWIAFNENQVKSATGNRGTFDPKDPDIRHQPIEADSSSSDVFSTDFEKELNKPRPWNIQVSAKDGRMSANDVRAAVAKLSPTEQEILKDAGLGNYLVKVVRPNAEDLKKWAEENVPRIEVKELFADVKVQKLQAEAYKAHRLMMDTKYGDGLDDAGPENHESWRADMAESSRLYKLAQAEYEANLANIAENDSATKRFDIRNINPRALNDMPGAVDLLVRYPKRTKFSSVKYHSDHFPQSGDNVLVHLRAYEHTMPDGEKVLRVFEVQSDWAQEWRKAVDKQFKILKNYAVEGKALAEVIPSNTKLGLTINELGVGYMDSTDAGALKTVAEYLSTIDPDPLLAHHQRLALKAAIELARKRGIKRVVIDDAETAMMTEGHDQQAHTEIDPGVGDELHARRERGELTGAEFARAMIAEGARSGKRVISQEKGMRLAYDQVLHQIMRELTGDGVKVEMGEHRNTMVNGLGKPREDLIFKNPDGTPKTQSTGFAYDTSAPQARRAAGEPFSYSGRKYQPLGPGASDPIYGLLPEREARWRGIFKGSVDRLKATKDPVKIEVADTLDETHSHERRLAGRYDDPIQEALAKLSEKQRKLLNEVGWEQHATGLDLSHRLPVPVRNAYKTIRGVIKQMALDQRAANHKLATGDERGMYEQYWPGIINKDVRRTLTEEQGSRRYDALRKEYIDYNEKMLLKKGHAPKYAKDTAEQYFTKLEGGLKAANLEDSFNFGAVSLHAGGKLPAHFMETDPRQLFKSYVNNFARARAFHDVVETNQNVMRALGREFYYDKKTGAAMPIAKTNKPLVLKDPDVQRLLKSAMGQFNKDTPFLSKIARAVHTGVIGNVVTKSADIIGTTTHALAFTPVLEWHNLVGNLKNYRADLADSFRMGINRRDAHVLRENVVGMHDEALHGLDRLSNFILRAGPAQMEQVARGLAQNTGRFIGETQRARALAGDKEAEIFLNKVTPKWKNLTHSELGAEIALIFQGKYNATNLPAWATDSSVAPFMRLMNWGIEQTNNFHKYDIEPASRGNLAPLLKHVVAAALGGYTEEKLRELITGKKSRVASIPELSAGTDSGRVGLEFARKVNHYLAVIGMAPAYTEVAGALLDVATKNRPQGITYPTYEMAANLARDLSSYMTAMAEVKGDRAEITLKFLHDLAQNNISAWRFWETNAARAGVPGLDEERNQLEESNLRRDKHISQSVRGKELRAPVDIKPGYENLMERRMEGERDITKMREYIQNERAKLRLIEDPIEREAKRRSLSSSVISWMPSQEHNPREFRDHLNFVEETQGVEAAERMRRLYREAMRRAYIRRGSF